MARVAVPVIRLTYAGEDAFTNEIVQEAMRQGLWEDDSCTFTGRIVVPIVPNVRVQFMDRLRRLLSEEQGDRLQDLLAANEWNVSFFVDCW